MRSFVEFVLIHVIGLSMLAVSLPLVGALFIVYRISKWQEQLPHARRELLEVLQKYLQVRYAIKWTYALLALSVITIIMASQNISIIEWFVQDRKIELFSVGFLAGTSGSIALFVVQFCTYPKYRQSLL